MLTEALKQWLIENYNLLDTATDEEAAEALGRAIADGSLSARKLEELSKSTDPVLEQFDQLVTRLEKLTEALTGDTSKDDDGKKAKESGADGNDKEGTKNVEPEGQKDKGKAKDLGDTISKVVTQSASSGDDNSDGQTNARVKAAVEMYDSNRKSLTFPTHTKDGRPHPRAGQRAVVFGRPLDEASERDKAIAGAWAKFLCATAMRGGSRTFGFQALPEHDRDLIMWALENEKWAGDSMGRDDVADIVDRKLTPREQKALIDDATSGGIEAAPIVFDDQVIQAPLLHGELYPLVNEVPLDRGRRVEGVSVSTVTGSWGGVDDSAISLFNTASFVSAFDTTIFRWEGAIKIGLDFLSDTPIDFANLVTQQYGERLLEDLDDVIAAGNGTTQPEGVINKSGATSVSFGNSVSIGSYESLRFGVSKAEHTGAVARTAVFCGTETSYQRARALPVGTSDARRLFGMDYDSYSLMGRPYKINEALTDAQIFYAILGRYRMYRRRGLTIRTSTEGDTLIRNNEMLVVAMARYGGQLERGACAAVTTDAGSA